jgi:hypothetical protein
MVIAPVDADSVIPAPAVKLSTPVFSMVILLVKAPDASAVAMFMPLPLINVSVAAVLGAVSVASPLTTIVL